MYVDVSMILFTITMDSISTMLLLQTPSKKIEREVMVTRVTISTMLLLQTPTNNIDKELMVTQVNNWPSTYKREVIHHFLIDENSIPNFFHISLIYLV
jgi:hypothetical protein